MHLLAIFCALLASAAIAFSLLNLLGLWSWRKQRFASSAATPEISILKPLKGCDEDMYACFLSHCEQQYPDYEIIFGVNSADDEAVPFVQRLQTEFPQHRITLLVCDEVLGANRKVSNLVQMSARATGRLLVINDSDIRVPATYLQGVSRAFADPSVGLVTCLYRGKPAQSLWSRLEALGICGDFMPGALTARLLEGRVGFAMGSTLAIDRDTLGMIGGLTPLVDYLADDYELAQRVVHAGKRVVIAEVVVETMLHDYSFAGFWEHQLRWGRTVRSSRRGGHAGLIVTYGLFWTLLALAAACGAIWAWALLVATLSLRVMAVLAYARALGDRSAVGNLLLLPIRDLLNPIIWMGSLLGSTIVWRGERFRLHKGRLQRES